MSEETTCTHDTIRLAGSPADPVGCVAASADACVPGAHGQATYTEECSTCGATREVNVAIKWTGDAGKFTRRSVGAAVEEGAWRPAAR